MGCGVVQVLKREGKACIIQIWIILFYQLNVTLHQPVVDCWQMCSKQAFQLTIHKGIPISEFEDSRQLNLKLCRIRYFFVCLNKRKMT